MSLLSQFPPMRRPPGELVGDGEQIEAVLGLERRFPDSMLLGVMSAAQAEAKVIGGLEPDAAIGAGSDMGAFDGKLSASGY